MQTYTLDSPGLQAAVTDGLIAIFSPVEEDDTETPVWCIQIDRKEIRLRVWRILSKTPMDDGGVYVRFETRYYRNWQALKEQFGSIPWAVLDLVAMERWAKEYGEQKGE